MNDERGENVITLYTLKTCDKCKQLKDGLDKEGIGYNTFNAGGDSVFADILEATFKCKKYPIAVYNINIWLPESSLLPSTNITIYNTIPELIEMIKSKIK